MMNNELTWRDIKELINDRIIEYIDRRYCYYIYKDNKIVIEFSISSVDYSVEYKKLDV